MFLVGRRLLLSGRTRCDPTRTAVVAHPVHRRIVDHCGVIGVVNVGDIHVVDRTVVGELSVVPAPALVTLTRVAVSIIDSAIETYVRAPVAFIESIPTVSPTPIAWSPEEADLGGHHPRAWHPVIIALAVGPVARCPDVALRREGWLLVHGQRWRRD